MGAKSKVPPASGADGDSGFEETQQRAPEYLGYSIELPLDEEEEDEDAETVYSGPTATELWEQMHPDQRLERREDVTVILPSLNESGDIAEKLSEYYIVQVRTEPGLARAIKAGIEDATTDIIVVMDADGEHPVRSVPQMLKLLDDEECPCEMACGVREEWGPGLKGWLSRRGNKWATQKFGLPFSDVTSGFWAARREKVLTLPSRIWHGYGDYYIDLVVCAFAADWWIGTVPILYGERISGKSHTRLLDTLSQYRERVLHVHKLMKKGELFGPKPKPEKRKAQPDPEEQEASYTVLKDECVVPEAMPEMLALPEGMKKAKRNGKHKARPQDIKDMEQPREAKAGRPLRP